MNPIRKLTGNLIRNAFRRSASFRAGIYRIVTEESSGKTDELSRFLSGFGDHLRKEADKYPSLFNEGNLHIRKAIVYAQRFNAGSDGVIIDAGAADGDTAMTFSKAFPSAHVYAFEPVKETYEKLVKNVASWKQIVPVNKALGSDKREQTIRIAGRITSSSFYEMETNLPAGVFAESLEETGSGKVVVTTMDHEIPPAKPVILLKMDVQGFELEVLRGGRQTLKRTAVVLTEMQNHDLYKGAPKYYEVDQFLVENGFQLYDIIPSLRQDGKLYEWDSIYINAAVAG